VVSPILGVVTIGQTPRPDLAMAFEAAAPHAVVRIAGALDALDDQQVRAIAASGDYPLLVRLASGGVAEVPMADLVPRVAAAALGLVHAGAAVVVVACAGGFPDIPCPVPLVMPGRVVPAVAGALSRSRRIGVVTPNRAQVPFATRKWIEDGFEPVVIFASPEDHAAIQRAGDDLADRDIDLIVLDCMGHDDECRASLAERTGRPVLAAQALVARVAASLI